MIAKIWNDLLSLVFPHVCALCGKSLIEGEDVICLYCLYRLPLTNFHHDRENKVELRFFGKIPVQQASALFYFNKGSDFRHLIHLLKYKDRKDVGEMLGRFAGRELQKSNSFQDIDYIIPIPLHKKKEKSRGYNQAESIALGLAESLSIPIDKQSVIRVKANKTQTRKNVFQRWQNVQEIFQLVDANTLKGKHLLIIDDVLTTGATIESCAQELLKIDGVKISIFTLAVAV